jgi:hypothetical protein
MSCCVAFDQAFEEGVIHWVPPREITDGPMMNQIISEYFLRKPAKADTATTQSTIARSTVCRAPSQSKG